MKKERGREQDVYAVVLYGWNCRGNLVRVTIDSAVPGLGNLTPPIIILGVRSYLFIGTAFSCVCTNFQATTTVILEPLFVVGFRFHINFTART